MKRSLILLTIFALMFATACKKDKSEDAEATANEDTEVEATQEDSETTQDEGIDASYEDVQITVEMESKSGSTASGRVIFKQKGDRVSMVAVLRGLDEGTHAIHIHESADCSSEDGTSTGGHWNPTGQPHGKFESEAGFHKGDIGNFEVDEDGRGTITVVTREWCIGCSDDTKNILNKAVIVHAGADDFKTQPTGNAGGRISCGGIIQ